MVLPSKKDPWAKAKSEPAKSAAAMTRLAARSVTLFMATSNVVNFRQFIAPAKTQPKADQPSSWLSQGRREDLFG
jgi:hypothetical protein